MNSKIHLTTDACGRIVRIFVTSGTTADCTLGEDLIEGFDAEVLLGDRAYDTNAIIMSALDAQMIICIPPKKNRKEQREYDKDLYKWRHIIENTILMLKNWRGIATRYAKNTNSFQAAVQIRAMFDWVEILV